MQSNLAQFVKLSILMDPHNRPVLNFYGKSRLGYRNINQDHIPSLSSTQTNHTHILLVGVWRPACPLLVAHCNISQVVDVALDLTDATTAWELEVVILAIGFIVDEEEVLIAVRAINSGSREVMC